MTTRAIILLSCSHDKRQGGAGYDPQARRIEQALPRTGRRLTETRLRVAKMLRGDPGSDRLYNDDMRGGFRDERACNRQLRLGPDLAGDEEASYLPACQRYAGRFFSRLTDEAPDFWDRTRTHPVEILFVSGLYGLLTWDELIQDYDCHFGDYTTGRKRNSLAGIWKGVLREALCEFVRGCRGSSTYSEGTERIRVRITGQRMYTTRGQPPSISSKGLRRSGKPRDDVRGCGIILGMVAIRFTSPEEAADGLMLLVRQGTVRALRGEIYVCRESALSVLEAHQIPYEKVSLPINLNEVDTLRDTPTTVL